MTDDVTMSPETSVSQPPRRRRRATAPATTVGAQDSSGELDPEILVSDALTGTLVPSSEQEKPKRGRTTRKKATVEPLGVEAAPAADDSGQAEATVGEGDEAIDEAAEEVVTDSTDAVGSTEPAPAEEDKESDSGKGDEEPPAEEEAAEASAEQNSTRVADLDVVAELSATFGPERSIPRLATTAVVFQAPEIRSRRAHAPAGPPKPAPESKAVEEPVDSDERADEELDDDQLDAEQGDEQTSRRRRRRGGRGRRGRGNDASDRTDEETDESATEKSTGSETQDESNETDEPSAGSAEETEESTSRRRRRRRRIDDDPKDEVSTVNGSTRLEAKRQRRREGRESGRRRTVITEAEFLARRESVDRRMIVREHDGRTQIALLEDGVLAEHYVAHKQHASLIGSVYLGKVQNVLPSMEAAFVDIGKGRNAVLYAGEVNWDAAGLEGQPRRIEQALSSGDAVLVQVTKDPVGHKGARLTSQITLAGRYLVYVPGGGMTGISRKLPEKERVRLKKLLREIVPNGGGVIVRTAAEGATEADLKADVERLTKQWAEIEKRSKTAAPPTVLREEPDLAIRVVRDIFNEDFKEMVVSGNKAWKTISKYVTEMAPDLVDRVHQWKEKEDLFEAHKIDAQLAKGLERKVWLPSGGSLVIDRTEAMTVVDVNTGKYTGSGGTLEETITRNNLEAAEEIVRQLRLRDIGGIIVIDFIDMVLEANRDLVLRRLVECLSRDRTKHQVAEVSSLGLVQMTRKRIGQGLLETFSTTCDSCSGRGYELQDLALESESKPNGDNRESEPVRRSRRQNKTTTAASNVAVPVVSAEGSAVRAATLATIAAAAANAHKEADETAADATDEDGGEVDVDAPKSDAE